MKNHEVKHAQSYFEKAYDINPNDSDILVNLGVIALKNDQQQQAIDFFGKALAQNPDSLEAKHNLAATFIQFNRFENALNYYNDLLAIHPNEIEYLYNAGVAELSMQKFANAKQHFEKLLNIEPKNFAALHNIALIFMQQKNIPTAISYLKDAIQSNPNHAATKHLLNALTQNNSDTCPQYAEDLFNHYALYYDKHMNENLQYTVPYNIGNWLRSNNYKFETALDLGCGTGLLGLEIQNICQQITGVDLAKNMLEIAHKKNCYYKLEQANIIDWLEDNTQKYDLIIAADVLPYFGNLTTLIQKISKRLNANGLFIFNTEISKTHEWQLQISARFAHSDNYLKTLCNINKLHIINEQTINGRLQDNLPLKLKLWVAQHP